MGRFESTIDCAPYAPDFNRIEKTFANIKRYRQSQLPETIMDEIIKPYGNYLE